MIHLFSVPFFANSPDKQHYLFEWNTQIVLDVVFGFGHARKVLKIDRVIRDEDLMIVLLGDEAGQRRRIKNQPVADHMQIIKEGVPNAVVWVIEVTGLGPKRNRNAC